MLFKKAIPDDNLLLALPRQTRRDGTEHGGNGISNQQDSAQQDPH